MQLDLRALVILLLALALVFSSVACTTIAAGRGTLVKAGPVESPAYNGPEFSTLIADSGPVLVGLNGHEPHSIADWNSFKTAHRGTGKASVGRLAVTVRDQALTPALVALDASRANAAEVAKLLLDPKLSLTEKSALTTQLRDHFLSLPESPSRLLPTGAQGGRIEYRYFPQLTIDLTASLQVADPLTRFEYVAVAIRIKPEHQARFINFAPKAADLYDFTVATLKQTASASAKLDATSTLSAVGKSGVSSESGDTTQTASNDRTRGSSFASGIGFSLSDELTREIRTALEARAAGVHDNGRLFVAELRSNDRRRISGTISHDLMLEIPSEVVKSDAKATIEHETSAPVDSTVEAEVRLVGVVRHVRKLGSIGTFRRVPEPIKDEVFHEVLVFEQTLQLWRFNGVAIARLTAVPVTNLTILTNEADASFTVQTQTGAVIASGVGRSSKFVVPAETALNIVFGPINRAAGDTPYSLSAPPIKVTVGKDTVASVVGAYTTTKP